MDTIPEFKHSISKHQMKSLLKKEDPTIIEIGGHYGEDTIGFLKAFEDPEVYCFEPDPRNIKIIKKYLDTTKFVLIEKAVSNKSSKKVNFYMSYKEDFDKKAMLTKYKWIDKKDYLEGKINRSGASSLKQGLDTVGNICSVETVTLDSWSDENNIKNIDFIWIDVQGAEKEVIEGATKILNSTKFCYMEYGETFYDGGLTRAETIALMKKRGFVPMPDYSNHGNKGNLLFKGQQV